MPLLQTSDHWLAAALEHAGHGLVVLDGEGIIKVWGGAMPRMSGLQRDGAVGRQLAELGLFNAPLLTAVESAKTAQTPRECNGRLLVTGFDLLCSVRVTPLVPQGVLLEFRDITEQVAQEEALLERSRKYELLFSAENDAVIFFDQESRRILDVNDAATMLYGYSRTEFLGMTMSQLSTDHAASKATFNLALHIGRLDDYAGWHCRKNGEVFPVEVSAGSFDLNEQQVMGVLIRDVTDRFEMERRLRDSESRYRAVVEDQNELVIRFMPQGKTTFANAAFLRFFGADEQSEHPLTQWLHAADREPFWQLCEQLSRNHPTGSVDTRVLGVAGEAWISWTVRAIFSTTGRLRGYQAVGHDITELRKAQQELAWNERLLRTMASTSPIASYVFAPKSQTIQFLDHRFGELWGLPELTEQALAGILNHAGIWESCRQLVRDPEGCTQIERGDCDETEFELLDGRTLRCLRTPLETTGGEDGVLLLFEDLTPRKRTEALKREFVTAVSHELRGPLTSLRGALSMLTGGIAGTLPEQARSLIAIAENTTERLTRLVNDILDVERIQGGTLRFHMQDLQLASLITNLTETMVAGARAQGITLRVATPMPRLRARVNPDRYAQVLSNLISNAVKFSPPLGVVEVSLTVNQGSLRTAVKDQGPGIPKLFRDQVFGKFTQGHPEVTREKGGVGLGLYLSKFLIDHMGGSIGFESEPGHGALFWFDLPEAENRAE